jgi:transcriptional regulator with XRE-family HTH domain
MQDREPTVRSREVGDFLRQAMRDAGYSGEDMARKLDWSASRVSRLVQGKRGGSDFLAICGVSAEERARLVKLCRDRMVEGWLQQYGSRLPLQVRTLVDHEMHATEISDFQSQLVHGLLQTGEYARAVISGCVNVPPAEVGDRVSARLGRAGLFSRDRPPKFTFYMHEFALRTPIGGCEVMSEQLHYLLRMSVRKYITLRVIPAAVGSHPALSGPFTLMDIPDFRPIVYIDSETSCLFLEKPEEIAAYRNILGSLGDVALNEGQSREVITRLAEQYAKGSPE